MSITIKRDEPLHEVHQQVGLAGGVCAIPVERLGLSLKPEGEGPPLHEHPNEEQFSLILSGQMHFVLGDEDRVVGFAAVVRNPTSWARHIAELSVIVGPEARHHGFGLRLTEEAFRAAEDMAVMRMIARMTLDQAPAIELFRHLGFVPMAILPDQVMDQDGQRYDLLVMHQDIERFVDTLRRFDAER